MKNAYAFTALIGVLNLTVAASLQAGSSCSSDASAGATATTVEAATPACVARTVTPVAEVRRGQTVTLQGEVVRLRDEDEFILRDSTGQIEIYIGWQNELPVVVGDQVTVEGRADDEGIPAMRPEIYARALILSNGQRIELR